MSDPNRHAGASGPGPGPVDQEIDVRAIGAFGAILLVVVALIFAAMWGMTVHLRSNSIARDPRPSPLAEARVPRLPPEPRLQPAPRKDMALLRAEEDAALTSYGWVDRTAGIARLPISRAMEILLEKGLPEVKAKPVPAPPGGQANEAGQLAPEVRTRGGR